MKGLEAFPEPWSVDARGDGTMIVRDARGFELLSLKASNDRDRLNRVENVMNATEGLLLAKAIARLPDLDRRPQY